MDLFKEISGWFYKKPKKISKNKSDYIFYKIIDSIDYKIYALQCINTNAIFHASLSEIVLDYDILHGLHPIQACYIGIEYGKYINNLNDDIKNKKIKNHMANNSPMAKYGNYQLCYQDREGNLCFIDVTTNKEHIMNPRDIALNEELISNFDASQAFFIGLNAGIKINKLTQSTIRHRHFYIVK